MSTENQRTLHDDLAALLNKHSRENGSNTPDFILAQHLLDTLDVFERSTKAREKWYGRGPCEVTGGQESAPDAPPAQEGQHPRNRPFTLPGLLQLLYLSEVGASVEGNVLMLQADGVCTEVSVSLLNDCVTEQDALDVVAKVLSDAALQAHEEEKEVNPLEDWVCLHESTGGDLFLSRCTVAPLRMRRASGDTELTVFLLAPSCSFQETYRVVETPEQVAKLFEVPLGQFGVLRARARSSHLYAR